MGHLCNKAITLSSKCIEDNTHFCHNFVIIHLCNKVITLWWKCEQNFKKGYSVFKYIWPFFYIVLFDCDLINRCIFFTILLHVMSMFYVINTLILWIFKTILHLEIQHVGHPNILFTFHKLFKVKGKKWMFQVSVHRPIVWKDLRIRTLHMYMLSKRNLPSV